MSDDTYNAFNSNRNNTFILGYLTYWFSRLSGYSFGLPKLDLKDYSSDNWVTFDSKMVNALLTNAQPMDVSTQSEMDNKLIMLRALYNKSEAFMALYISYTMDPTNLCAYTDIREILADTTYLSKCIANTKIRRILLCSPHFYWWLYRDKKAMRVLFDAYNVVEPDFNDITSTTEKVLYDGKALITYISMSVYDTSAKTWSSCYTGFTLTNLLGSPTTLTNVNVSTATTGAGTRIYQNHVFRFANKVSIKTSSQYYRVNEIRWIQIDE
jgi:hypothetical protein